VADVQEWLPVAAEYFLVQGDTVEKDKCHFGLMSAALGWEHLVVKAGEASQASGSVAVAADAEEVLQVLMVVAVEESPQVSGSVVEEGTQVLMEAAAGETHWVSVMDAGAKQPPVLMGVVVEEILQVLRPAVAKQEGTVVSVDQVW